MLKVGVTGGIGAGKTTVCKMFECLEVPVFYADDEGKRIMVEDRSVKNKVKALFGSESYHSDGTLNRKHIAFIVFNKPAELKKLNNIIHPIVRENALKWFKKHKASPYAIYEAALIFETGGEKMFDKVISVSAPKYMRIQRIRLRDGVRRKDVLARMARQMDQRVKDKKADIVIKNNLRKSLIKQVQDADYYLKKLSEKQ